MNEPGSNPVPVSPEDLALYAMQALPAEEMAAVAAALRDNPQAQQELARIQGDLALLALSADQQPAPAGSFERLQARMRETFQAAKEFATSVAASKSNRDDRHADTAVRIALAPSPRRSKWAIITPWAIAACLAIACSILGYRVASLNDALDGESAPGLEPRREGLPRPAGARSPERARMRSASPSPQPRRRPRPPPTPSISPSVAR